MLVPIRLHGSRAILALSLVVALAACSGGDGAHDGEPPPAEDASLDGPTLEDGAPEDAAAEDGGVPDAGTADAGAPDAAPPIDAGALDAGPPTDAGASDAGPRDAGTPVREVLLVGRCTNASGVDCASTTDDGATFTQATGIPTWDLVPGGQGFLMLLFALRTWGIDGGDPSMSTSADNPLVVVDVRTSEGRQAAFHEGRLPFHPSAEEPGALDLFGVQVVLILSASYVERTVLDATVTVTDKDGVVRTATQRLIPVR